MARGIVRRAFGFSALLEEAQHLEIETRLSDSIFMPNRRVAFRWVNGLEEVATSFNQPEPTVEGVAFSGELKVSQPAVGDWVDRLLRVLRLP